MPAFPIRSARPAVAVPPGRMGYDISEDRILLHTIQTAEAFGVLLINGVLKPDPALAEPPLHADGYDWMYRQMDARLPTSGDGAIWLWARIRRQSLVELCRLAQGQVLLTCRVPRERVLLSHFGDWHAVLNRHPLIIEHPDESDEAYGARLDRIFEDVDSRVRAAGVSLDAGYCHWPRTFARNSRTAGRSYWTRRTTDATNAGRQQYMRCVPTMSCRPSGLKAEHCLCNTFRPISTSTECQTAKGPCTGSWSSSFDRLVW